MLDKSFTIKDFFIYLLPGLLNLILSSMLIYQLGIVKDFDFISTANNFIISAFVISFSFLIGFILSQFQIIIFNFFNKKRLRELRKLDVAIEINEFKPIICYEIKKEFKLVELNNEMILNNNQLFFYCYSFIIEYSNDKSIELVNRSNYLSSFATTLFIPILLIIINAFFLLRVNCCIKMFISILTVIISYMILRKIIFNFKSEFYNNTFRAFYLIKSRNNL